MPPPILLDTMADGGAITTAMHMCLTVYVPPPFISILLAGELSLLEAWHMIWGEIVMSNQEVDFWAVVDWLRVGLVFSAPSPYSPCSLW